MVTFRHVFSLVVREDSDVILTSLCNCLFSPVNHKHLPNGVVIAETKPLYSRGLTWKLYKQYYSSLGTLCFHTIHHSFCPVNY